MEIQSRYKNGLIYKLVCKDVLIKDCYVGSTCNFSRRKNAHKSVCNNQNSKKYNLNVYIFIRDNGNWENWDMIQIKTFSCNTKRELETEERKEMELIGANLNKNKPNRSKKEWYSDNKEKIKEHYEINKEYNKEYYELHKEEKKEYQKKYQETNNLKLKEQFLCKCGGKYKRVNKTIHDKTKKHLKNLIDYKD